MKASMVMTRDNEKVSASDLPEKARRLLEVIKGRRSVRRYRQDLIDDHIIQKLIEAAVHTPTACNIQGWKFIVVNDRRLIQEMFDRGGATFLRDAPQGILVCYENRTDNVTYQDPVQSAAAAVQNMILMAHCYNIGCCWVLHLPPKRELRRMFKIPRTYDPVAFVSMGYYSYELRPHELKYTLQDVYAYNTFDFKKPKLPLIDWRILTRRILRQLYYLCPKRKYLYPLAKRFEKKFYN